MRGSPSTGRGSIRASAAGAAALALLCAIGGRAPDAHAEDALPPPPDMKAQTDPKGLVSIELPRGTTEVGPDEKDAFSLQRWGLCWNEKPGPPFAYLYLKHVPGYARAPLCGWVRGPNRNGERIESTVKIGETDFWETRNFEGKGFLLFRVIEHEGQCFEAYVQARTSVFESVSGQFEQILATMKGAETPPAFEVPAGFREMKEKDVEAWSDAKKTRDVQRVVKMHRKAWETMAEAMPGEPFLATPPRVIVCDDDAAFDALWTSGGGAPEFCFDDVGARALVVRLSKRRDGDFEQAIYRSACLQYVRMYFGGPVPPWIEDGLRMYGALGVLQNAKFDQPLTKAIRVARDASQRRNATLEDLFALGKADPVDRNNRDHELYAWHWFFRHGPGAEKYGDLYRRHLAELRESGNVLAARKVWESANMDDMRAEFQAWIAEWRE